MEPDRRGVVEAVAGDFGALATQVYLRWMGKGAVNQLDAVGELGGTLYGNNEIGNDTDVRLGLNAKRFLAPRLLVEGGISGWRFRRSNLEAFNVDMARVSGRMIWAPGRTWAVSASGRYNRLDFVDRVLPPDTSGVGGDGDVVVVPLGPENERDRQVDLSAGVQRRLGGTAFVALDVTHRWTESNQDPVRYRGPSVLLRFGKQVTGRLDMTAYAGRTWRSFLEPYPVLEPGGVVASRDRDDRAWQFGFGLQRPVTSRVNLHADGFWMNQHSSIQDFAFDQARFSIGVGIDLASTGTLRLRWLDREPGLPLMPRPTEHGVRFRYQGSSVESVSVVGDFNGWNPERHPMMQIEENLWEIIVPLDPGIWRYAFVVDGRWLRPPGAPWYEDDGFGGENGVLEVQASGEGRVTGAPESRQNREYSEPVGLGVSGAGGHSERRIYDPGQVALLEPAPRGIAGAGRLARQLPAPQ